MTIYNFNLLVGYLPSGVDYAQGYRAKLFRDLHQESYFIFTEAPEWEYIKFYLEDVGLKEEELKSLHLSYLDDVSLIPQLSFDEVKAFYPEIMDDQQFEWVNDVKAYTNIGNNHYGINFSFKNPSSDIVSSVAIFLDGNLIRRDFYTNRKLFSKYYHPKLINNTLSASTYKVNFYNREGQIVFEENLASENPYYIFANQTKRLTKFDLVEEFVTNLKLSKHDTLIMDRSADMSFAQVLMKHKGPAKLVAMIHSEHFFPKNYDPSYLYLNYEYYYIIRNAHLIDYFVTSTELQKINFAETVINETGVTPTIKVIPVGSVEIKESLNRQRQPFSMMTASRLYLGKRVDLLVSAAILAKKEIPQLEFSIYGRGHEEARLERMITEQKAQDYIFLKGHLDLNKIYPQYELYVSASPRESFGLSLLEAISHGLAMIGLNVPYGNPTFIENGANGYLVDYDHLGDQQVTIEALAEKMISYFKLTEIERQSFNDKSSEIAKRFTKDKVKAAWLNLLQVTK
ncbi:glycosyltransferase [Streptococcus hongkongensis]|nr:accessory Sec system glycosylation protein GtfA [Streptococcus uberis]